MGRTAEQLERHREWMAGYRVRNRDVINEKQRVYCMRPDVKDQRRVYVKARPVQMLLAEARKRAKRKGLPFTITEADIEIPAVCPVLGISLIQGGPRANWPSLDRRVNTIGYVPGNAFVISHRANNLKGDATTAEVEHILRYMRGSS